MRQSFGALAVVLLAVMFSMGQSTTKLSLVVSPGAPGTISVTRLNHCLEELAREWKVPTKDIPHIMVFHVSRAVAETAFVTDDMAVRRNSGGQPGAEYFEVWLVGEPRFNYVLALQNVIEYHFGLRPAEQERTAVLVRVARMENATVNAGEGK